MIILFCFVYLFVFVLSVIEIYEYDKRKNKAKVFSLYFFVITIFLVLFATFRPDTMQDYQSYYLLFKGLYLEEDRIEIGDIFLIKCARYIIDTPIFVFFVFALAGIITKVIIIKKMTPVLITSMFLYLSNIFIIYDLIQIRCGIAAGLLLWAIYFKCERNLLGFGITALLAILFHYQALVIIPLILLSSIKTHKKYYLLLIIISYILAFAKIGFAKFAGLLGGEGYVALFEHYGGRESIVNIFNIVQIFKLVTFLILYRNIDYLASISKYTITLVKVYALSICSLLLLADMSVVGFRVSEFLQISEIILIPMIAMIGGHKMNYCKLWCFGYAISLFFIDAVYNKYFILQ